ncbi:MAG: ABC transporter ATP-binding protein [Burkholderiaceae bacterium]|nr:MAG: ABC transporter ATP-binding protein [Burkholderiaceae bacterium]
MGANMNTPLIEARQLRVRYGSKEAVKSLDFQMGKGRVVGLLGHNGAGKSSMMKAIMGLQHYEGELRVLGLDPLRQREKLLHELCYIPDVAILPRWATAQELIQLMSGLHPRFSAERARQLLQRTSVQLHDKVKQLSKGMVVQLHLALIAAIDARLMILDEPTLGLDILSRKSFYEMLVDEWCNGERTVLISTHQVEEIESLLSDVMMLNEGRLVLNLSLEDVDRRFTALAHDPSHADQMSRAHPLLRYRTLNREAAIFEGEVPPEVLALGDRVRPSLVDLFVALTRAPELHRQHS